MACQIKKHLKKITQFDHTCPHRFSKPIAQDEVNKLAI